MLRIGNAIIGFPSLSLNGSNSEGSALFLFIKNNMLTSFNLFVEAKLQSINISNANKVKSDINKIYESLNENGSKLGIKITREYFNVIIDEIQLTVENEIKKEQEKEELKVQKEIIKEQKEAEKELQKQKEALEKEMKHYVKQLERTEKEEQKEEIVAEIKRIEESIKSNDYRLANNRAGYLYVISNDDMKDGMVKIGVSRRLDPMERVNELGNASHSFKFKVHGMVFSDDCFKLESDMHNYFKDKRVNKINTRKEFFFATLEEVEKALTNFGINAKLDTEIVCDDYIMSL